MSDTTAATGKWSLGLAQRLRAALDWLAATDTRSIAVLVLLSLACFAPGQMTIPPVDRDEARFAQATTQMLETGEFIDIRLHDNPRYDKPVGIHWLQAIAVSLIGGDVPAAIWVYRLPSLIGACLIVLLAYWAALPLGDRRIAIVAGMMMAALLLLNVEARLAKTDAVLNASILVCQAVLLRLYLRGPELTVPLGWAVSFWVAVGIGVLVKGPILLFFVGLTVIAASLLQRGVGWLSGLRPLPGLAIALAIALPWYVGIWFATDGAFYAKAIGYSITDKITTGMQSHGAPPGYYFALFWLTAWPIAAVAATSVPWMWRERRSALVGFVAAWVVPSWIAYELFATKLPHYVLPLYPAIAIVGAASLVGGHIDPSRWWVRLLFSLAALGPVTTIGAAAFAAIYLGGGVPVALIPLALVVAIAVVAALILVGARELLPAWLLLAVVAAPVTYAGVFGVVAPNLSGLWLSPRLAEAATEVAGCAQPGVIAVGNREASLMFAIGTDIEFGNGEEAANFLAGGDCRAAIVEAASEQDFVDQLQSVDVVPGPAVRVLGINIGNGDRLDFGVYGRPR